MTTNQANPNQVLWEKGDFTRIADSMRASGEALVTEALIDEGFSDDDIAKVMGGNVLKLLSDGLPE